MYKKVEQVESYYAMMAAMSVGPITKFLRILLGLCVEKTTSERREFQISSREGGNSNVAKSESSQPRPAAVMDSFRRLGMAAMLRVRKEDLDTYF